MTAIPTNPTLHPLQDLLDSFAKVPLIHGAGSRNKFVPDDPSFLT